MGDHAVVCQKGGITRRHNAVRDELQTSLHRLGFEVAREAALPDLSRPADLLVFSGGRGGRPVALDVTVLHPPPLSAVEEVLSRAEDAKVTKYKAACELQG